MRDHSKLHHYRGRGFIEKRGHMDFGASMPANLAANFSQRCFIACDAGAHRFVLVLFLRYAWSIAALQHANA